MGWELLVLTILRLWQVFVGNLPPDAEGRDLYDFFRKYGQINDAWVARKPPGFGFVWFDHDRDAVHFPDPVESPSAAPAN